MVVALALRSAQLGFHGFHGVEETTLVYKRDQHQGLPVLLLAVHVRLKVFGVETHDRR